MAKLYLSTKHAPAASTVLWFLGLDVISYFPTVIVVSKALTTAHGFAILLSYWRYAAGCSSPPQAQPNWSTKWVHSTGGGSSSRSRRSQRSQRSERSSARESNASGRSPQSTLVRWDHELERRCGADFYELTVLAEIALSTFQAYKMSHLVASCWINRLLLAVIVTNCWFMTMVHVIFRKKTPAYVKAVHLALDAALEIVYGTVVPLAIFYPYYRDVAHILYDAPYLNFYLETWFIDAITENRQIFVTSWIDFLSKKAAGVSLLLRLYALQMQQRVELDLQSGMSMARVDCVNDATSQPGTAVNDTA